MEPLCHLADRKQTGVFHIFSPPVDAAPAAASGVNSPTTGSAITCTSATTTALDPLANALVSFVCAMQVHTFHKIHGHVYASTMCIGNLRSAAEALGEYLHSRSRASLDAAKTYFGVILVFAAGAGLGSLMTEFTDIRAIWVCCGLLLVSFILMFIRDDQKK